jgi:hypothetical protein
MKYLVRYEAVINGATKDDFFKDTEANFASCGIPSTAPDYTSNSGSSYWYTDEGVVRVSDHWIGAASCRWTLDGITENETGLAIDKREAAVAGFCRWADFSREGFIEGVREMPKGTRKGGYVFTGGIGYKVLEKVA